MSKIKHILTLASDAVEKAKGDTISKPEMQNILDELIEALPAAQAMDEQQLDIFVLYMNHLNNKMDLLFNATALCGLALSNDMVVRKNIKDMEAKFNYLQAKFSRDMQRIVDPAGADAADQNDVKVRQAAKDATQTDTDPRKK